MVYVAEGDLGKRNYAIKKNGTQVAQVLLPLLLPKYYAMASGYVCYSPAMLSTSVPEDKLSFSWKWHAGSTVWPSCIAQFVSTSKMKDCDFILCCYAPSWMTSSSLFVFCR